MKKFTCFLALMLLSVSLIFGQTKTGTLKIFSELTGTVVYLDESRQADNTQQINNVPIGNHYLKVLKDGVSVYGELVTIQENTVTTVLIKNTGQVQEKIMDSKVAEREQYNNNKVEVVFSTNSVSQTTGRSSMYPGYYGYYGFSSSNTVTSQVADFKIIKGGVKEIGDVSLATLVNNQAVLNQNAADNLKVTKMTSWGAGLFLGGLLIGGAILIDGLSTVHPFLHPVGGQTSGFEDGVFVAALLSGTFGYYMVMNADKIIPAHYYSVDGANRDAQAYDKKLKEKLGLPESYDVK